MKKTVKRILIVAGIILCIPVLILGVIFYQMTSAMSEAVPLETGSIGDDILVIRDGISNIFFVRDGSQYILFDCANDKASVAEQMEVLGISPADVTAVFLTHTDSDHVGALGLFDHAKLYFSPKEEQMINGQTPRFFRIGKNSIHRTDYTLLDDRQQITIGNLTVQSYCVPGHTTGAMAYLVNDKYLFTGDVLSLEEGKIAPIPPIFNMNTPQALESMEIIRHIPKAEYIFTAHWGYTDDYLAAVE